MAKKNQGTYAPTGEWGTHLRRFSKRKANQRERRAVKKRIEKEIKEVLEAE